MNKRKNGSSIDGRGNARSRFKPAALAQLAAVITVAAAIPLAGSGAAQAATQSAKVVVSGAVLTSTGKAAAGATVVIHAWPDQAVIQALKPGQKVPWVLVGTGSADASGKYSISVPVAKLAPEESYGVVNLEADTSSSTYFFPVAVTRNDGDAYMPSANVVADLTATPGVTPATPGWSGCAGDGWNYVKDLGEHLATVGETYVLTSHATQHFVYKVGQSSTIGVGTSASGKYGSFKDWGTFSWSTNLRESFATFGANKSMWYRSLFNFGEYTCRILGYTFYATHVNGYDGGTYYEKPSSIPNPPGKNCVRQGPDTTAGTESTAAVTWTRSLGVGSGFGFWSSVQTGFDRSAKVQYSFSAWRSLCGQDSPPGENPGQLIVRT